MPPLRRVSSCSPSARARTVTAHSLRAIGIGVVLQRFRDSSSNWGWASAYLACTGRLRPPGARILEECSEISTKKLRNLRFVHPSVADVTLGSTVAAVSTAARSLDSQAIAGCQLAGRLARERRAVE